MFSHSLASWFSWHTLEERYSVLKSKCRSLLNRKTIALAKAYFTPTAIAKNKTVLALFVACGALIGLIVSAAWAVAAFLHLLLALLFIYAILTKVFEIRLDVDPS